MTAGWRHDLANFLLIGGNLAILLFGFKAGTPQGWSVSFILVGLSSFWAWHANLKCYRTITDTPTSRIASAPQGYVEIIGRGRQPPGARLLSPVNGLPCLWFRYRIERRNGDSWELVESGVSHDTFGVDDGSGLMLIDPEGAEILTSRRQVSIQGGYRMTEWTLIEGETIYAIGEHATLGGPNAVLDKQADVAGLLAQWKADKQALLARFDTDRDGEISLEEWESARKAASDEVDRAHFDIRLAEGIHVLRKPAHDRPFLVASRDVTALVRYFRLWSWAHLTILAGALLGWLLLPGRG